MLEQEKNITVNKKAEFLYFIEQRLEAGISLVGTEVKSLRQNNANLTDGYAVIRDGEVWLMGAHIGKYDHGNIFNHEPVRKRKLLLKKSEIRKLKIKIDEKGYTLIPLRLYFKEGKIKVELGLARGKKSFDKRDSIAKKDLQRDMERNFKV
ncbi:MAG: SsrA-binding protein [Ignavibacteriae bacterium HGW-Ignavibacteriae-2]|jgi:SsrA-binding protein|nr:SsrA-binding protein SmpB [Bacteroidota bacterium]PKL89135.1 MAG: SsrA-binding protein [Ignavibacteriae bacterium HGW-Ignavibacteriae-2]